jgi:hypothetical protein
VRKVFDRPPYLVPLQESWQGKRCGPFQVDEPRFFTDPVSFSMRSVVGLSARG